MADNWLTTDFKIISKTVKSASPRNYIASWDSRLIRVPELREFVEFGKESDITREFLKRHVKKIVNQEAFDNWIEEEITRKEYQFQISGKQPSPKPSKISFYFSEELTLTEYDNFLLTDPYEILESKIDQQFFYDIENAFSPDMDFSLKDSPGQQQNNTIFWFNGYNQYIYDTKGDRLN